MFSFYQSSMNWTIIGCSRFSGFNESLTASAASLAIAAAMPIRDLGSGFGALLLTRAFTGLGSGFWTQCRSDCRVLDSVDWSVRVRDRLDLDWCRNTTILDCTV